jgi:hypothetical protein
MLKKHLECKAFVETLNMLQNSKKNLQCKAWCGGGNLP